MEITHLQGNLALQNSRFDVGNQDGEQATVRADDAGRSAWKEPAATLSMRDAGKAVSDAASKLPPSLKGAGDSAGGVSVDKTLPPILRGAQKGAGGNVAPAKPVQDGVLRPLNEKATPDAGQAPAANDQLDLQAKSEPVMRAIKEKVNNLFKVYPNGGSERHAEKVPSHAKSAPKVVPGLMSQKKTVSVDMYA
ncbi:MAG: hypothetical protein HQL63_08740 [Magnetococcales bacterium]|nr:hypothetical protein [Magnetococcales bacterium]MBF0322210.1 hypothetical protein [Magnetococcales bacterium]